MPDDYVDEEEDEGRTSAGKMVDPMTTSLGREEELVPYPGPDVVDEPVDDDDGQRLYACFAKYPPAQEPNEVLQAAHESWLGEWESRGHVFPPSFSQEPHPMLQLYPAVKSMR